MKTQKPSEKPKVSKARKRFVEIRNRLREIIPENFTYIPRDAECFLKVGTPDELMDPLSNALLFSLPLSKEDQDEALAHAEKCGTTIPEEYLRNQ